MKRKSIQILMVVGSVLFSTYCISDFIRMARQKHTRDLSLELAAVIDGLDKIQAGLPRAEQFLTKLKAVDASRAPVEIRQALSDYIASLEGALDAMKSGRDTSSYDKPMAESKERLRESLGKYEAE